MMVFHKQKGFTILEIIVVVMILGLISTLLMQALVQVLNLRDRFLDFSYVEKIRVLQKNWFENTVASLTSDYENIENAYPFKGSNYSFEGITLAPLNDSAFVPTFFRWKIIKKDEGNLSVLVYEEKNTELEIMKIKSNEASFHYVSRNEHTYDVWPPIDSLEKENQIPEAIIFNSNGNSAITWFVKVYGKKTYREDFRVWDLNE